MTECIIMSAKGPRDEFKQLSDKEYLNQLLDSNHRQIYKKESVLFLPLTIIIGVVKILLQAVFVGNILEHIIYLIKQQTIIVRPMLINSHFVEIFNLFFNE